MKVHLFLTLFTFVVLMTSSCKWDKKGSSASSVHAGTDIKLDSFVQKGALHQSEGDTSYSYVSIVYPTTLSLGNIDASIISTIKAHQLNALQSVLFIEDSTAIPNSIEACANTFIASSEIDPKDKEAFFRAYFFEADMDTLFVGKEVVSIVLSDFYYTGGAHPLTNTTFLNFDRNSGKTINIIELAKDTVAFKKVVQAALEANEKQELGNDYDAKSYFFDDGFALPQNMAITRSGLQCLYNPYEAAAYARGPILFTIPWKDLHGIITQYVPLDDVKLGDDLQ